VADAPRVAILPAGGGAGLATAVESAGGVVVADPANADALVWTATGFEPGFTSADLVDTLRRHPDIRWIQLPWAGVEPYAEAGVFDRQHLWTSAKGVYSTPVAEHALALTLAGFRDLKRFGQARRWTAQSARSLCGASVTIFGGGGITDELIRLLGPFGCRITVVRKRPVPMPEVERVAGWDDRDAMLAGADAVILALALTPETRGFLGRRQFDAMENHAWLVNVARGRHVVTAELVDALAEHVIGGAALDVTDPEPLPEGHPSWVQPNCLITPHTANTQAMAAPLLAGRVADNVRRFSAGLPLAGQVDPELGY
jgi:phosphoglycerate dehydrogenase-like enzyme